MVAFAVVFALFVVATVLLAVLTLRWAIRRDRANREAYEAERSGEGSGGEA